MTRSATPADGEVLWEASFNETNKHVIEYKRHYQYYGTPLDDAHSLASPRAATATKECH